MPRQNKTARPQRQGFLLIEALLALLILSLVLVASLGAIAQGLRIAKKGEETTRALLTFEKILFDLETGKRLDWVLYGGKGEWDEKYQYEMTSRVETNLPLFSSLKTRLSWKEGRGSLQLETFLFGGAHD